MEKRLIGAILNVKDIDKCRHFYRTVIGLGDPHVDSNLWVEFRLPAGGVLALRKQDELPELPKANRLAWALATDNLNAVMVRLQENGHSVKDNPEGGMGFKLYETGDPEGNPLFLYALPAIPADPII